MVSAPARRFSIGDLILGIILFLLGLFVLGNTVVATAFSVLLIGWVAVIAGIVGLVSAVVNRRGSGMWMGIVSGVLLVVLGILILLNPVAGAFGLTVVLGIVFFARGITSLIAGFTMPAGRVWFIIGGLISLALGIIVLFNLFTMTPALLGILLGVELIVYGLTLAIAGRPQRTGMVRSTGV